MPGPPPTQVTAERTSTAGADIDGSGSVGVSNLLSLLASRGLCKGCPADFDGDGTVDALDIEGFLSLLFP